MPGQLIRIAYLISFSAVFLVTAAVTANERQALRHQGVLLGSQIAPIASTLAAKIRTIVPEGTVVKRGDLLVTLDDTDINKQLDKQQVNTKNYAKSLADARMEVESLTAEHQLEIKIADKAIEVAELERSHALGENGHHQQALTLAEGKYQESLLMVQLVNRTLEQLKGQTEADSVEWLKARREATQANTSLQVATQNLQHLQGAGLDLLRTTLELSLLQAKIERIAISRKQREAIQQVSKTLVSRERALQSATKRLEQYEEYLAQCQIFAPFDAIVQWPDNAAKNAALPAIGPGTAVRPGRPILQLVKADSFEVELQINEGTLAQVHVDQPATIQFEAAPGSSFSGRVDRIYRRPQGAQATNQGTYNVRVSVDSPSPSLRVGMTATVDLQPRP
ncbi:MAG: HlyD family efflux transporter periplasmic adaptor subunit [Pirellulaceae bacterium]|nr:HlyD family efflux transporter periplasmic adaptor subunit [Pirellulaceae bacterium]